MYRKIIKTGFVTLFVASITWFSVPAAAYYNDQDNHLTDQERHRIYEREQANRNYSYNQNHQLTDRERHRIYEQNQANRNSQRNYGHSQYYRHDSRWNNRCVYYKNHHRHVRNKRSCRR